MIRLSLIVIIFFSVFFQMEAGNSNKGIGLKTSEVIVDTVFLPEKMRELPEVIIESKKFPLLHILAYVREYSTLTTYRDTIFLFREKMVDYIVPLNDKLNFRGWTTPRILSSRSYYNFKNNVGLDSVSDECMYHFSWSDWIGLPPRISIPQTLRNNFSSTHTLKGKYRPSEIWTRINDRIDVNVNLLADTISRKWMPSISNFFENGVDYDKFNINYRYQNVLGNELNVSDLEGYSYSIESIGRGRNMFRFNRKGEPYYVSTDAEIYFVDKEYITLQEGNKWDKHNFNPEDLGIWVSSEAPPLSTTIVKLIARVDQIDKKEIRLSLRPDKKLGHSKGIPSLSRAQKALSFLKKILRI